MMGRAASTNEDDETMESMAMAPLRTFPGGIFAVSGHVQQPVEQFFAAFPLGNTLARVTGKGSAPASALLRCFYRLENSRVPLVPNGGNGEER